MRMNLKTANPLLCPKVTNIGNKLSSKASPLLRKSELLYIRDKISYNDIKYYFAFLQKDRESGV